MRTNLEWGGGIGIGTGEMLSILRLNVPFGLITTFSSYLLQAFSQALQNEYLFSPVKLVNALSSSIISSSVAYMLFSLGMFVGIYRLKSHILHDTSHNNMFTTVWFCPRFLFVYFHLFIG